jgi:hypothetical protein
MDFAEKNIFARRINRFKDEKEYYHLRDDAREEMDEEIADMRREWMQTTSLTKANMLTLLKQLGITLKEAELRALIDAFDSNGDGMVTLREFLDFTGPKRDKRSGNSLVMSQRCCWMTTCKTTGMANGYSVSAATKRYLKNEESKGGEQRAKRRSDEYDERDEYASKDNDDANNASFTGNVVIRKLANGESRMCVELKERGKREEVLKKLGLIRSLDAVNEGRNKQREEDAYDEDYEEVQCLYIIF